MLIDKIILTLRRLKWWLSPELPCFICHFLCCHPNGGPTCSLALGSSSSLGLVVQSLSFLLYRGPPDHTHLLSPIQAYPNSLFSSLCLEKKPPRDGLGLPEPACTRGFGGSEALVASSLSSSKAWGNLCLSGFRATTGKGLRQHGLLSMLASRSVHADAP